MSFSFRPAKRENIGLLIGLASGTGGGKTKSAMELATGICGGEKFAFIDTESRRGLHYADEYNFDHGDLQAPFTPAAYLEAIMAADKAGYPAIVVDSMSHEWAGEGGCLDMQEAEFQRLGGRDSVKMLSWAKCKGEHKRMVQRLLQVRAHLILCFRAEDKIDMVKEGGKTVIVPKVGPGGFKGWLPICEKNMPFELTCSFLLMADRPGYPIPIKLQDKMRPFFPLDEQIGRAAGERIARWARGEDIAPASTGAKRAPKQDTPEALAASVTALAGLGVDAAKHLGREPAVTDLPALRTLYAERKAAPAAGEGRAF